MKPLFLIYSGILLLAVVIMCAQGSDSACGQYGGRCQDISLDCPSEYLVGYCSGSSSRRCCVESGDCSGRCQYDNNPCFFGYATGRCPGPADFRCCRRWPWS